eukprot:1012364-Prymnesium_polylepis.1
MKNTFNPTKNHLKIPRNTDGICLVDAKQAILERIDPSSPAVFDGLGEELEADDGGGVFASARPA